MKSSKIISKNIVLTLLESNQTNFTEIKKKIIKLKKEYKEALIKEAKLIKNDKVE